jgi:phosphoglycerate dehydrogenase-like enzyme
MAIQRLSKTRKRLESREIREFAGDPHEFVNLVNDIDILVVYHAPVTVEPLERKSQLRVIGCARGDSSNVDVDEATDKPHF